MESVGRVCAPASTPSKPTIARSSGIEKPRSAELCHAAHRIAIGSENQRRDGHCCSHELLGDVATAELTVVERVEEPFRMRINAMGKHGGPVCVVPRAHVGLDEVCCEADARVAVADQVVDGVRHTCGVVGRCRRNIETLHLVTRQRHGLASCANSEQVGLGGGGGNRDDAVEMLPGCRRGVIGRRDDLVASQAGVECLQQHDTAADGSNLAGDSCHDLAVVEPAGDRREHSDNDRFRDLQSLRLDRVKMC